jgi:hypothetical protein
MVNLASDTPAPEKPERGKNPVKPGGWLVPGEEHWEIREPGTTSDFPLTRTIEDEAPAPGAIALVALPPRLVTCQLFWLDTTDEKAVPDLLRMQCERRLMLRQDEVWSYRIVRAEAERMLAQVLILQNTIPALLEGGGEARFEAQPRCLELPPRTVCLLRSLGAMQLIITDATGVLYFQSLPHQTLSRECVRDVQSILWMATAQDWIDALTSITLLGVWTTSDRAALKSLDLPIDAKADPLFTLPAEPMELTPKSVSHLRLQRQRQHRVRLIALGVAAIYAVFLSFQILTATFTSLSNARLQSQLNALLPEMTDLQTTARRLDALNPALDTRTYPLEILHRIMANLPDKGVRLTRFEIVGNRVEIAGESTTTREAFDFLHAVQTSDALNYVSWEDPPQPVPLPNDTARFSIQGTIAGAYEDAEES